MKFGARYSAMENLGGDLYDIIRIGRNSYGFVMADVSGHGVPAALITTMAKVSFHSHAKWGMSTSEILDNINAEMFRFIGDLEYYLTAFFCILNLETGELHYTNAGHHAGIVYRKKTGAMESLDTKGYFIGSFEDGNYETGSTVLQPGDRILLFTDGIIEARNEEGEFFEYNRLRNYIKTNHSLPPKDFVAGLADNLQSFCGKAPQTDDQAILQVEFVKRLEGGAETEALDIQVRQLSKADEPEESAIIDYAGEYARAIELMKAGSYDEACAALERLLLIKPSDVKVLNNLGVLYYKRKDYEVAKRFLERALIAEPNNASAVKNLRAVEKALVAAG
jgi:sigma-B regulation protein RsbU (phosphoserine phosphatase)